MLREDQITRLLEMTWSQLKGVERGEIAGYDQSKEDELKDLRELVDDLYKLQDGVQV
jgi:hypothetical protein